ncbi:hypothetical protein D3C75_1058260 [compost metagenome]
MALGQVIFLAFFVHFLLFLAPDQQVAIDELDLDILGIHARQLGADAVFLGQLADVHGRHAVGEQVTPPERFDIERCVAEWHAHRPPSKILEQAVDLTAQLLEGPPQLRRFDAGRRTFGWLAGDGGNRHFLGNV